MQKNLCAVLGQIAWWRSALTAEICAGPYNRLLRRQHCSSLCSQSEGHEHVANMASASGHDFVGFSARAWPPQYSSPSLCEQSELQCFASDLRRMFAHRPLLLCRYAIWIETAQQLACPPTISRASRRPPNNKALYISPAPPSWRLQTPYACRFERRFSGDAHRMLS